jgi:hypothetical protein
VYERPITEPPAPAQSPTLGWVSQLCYYPKLQAIRRPWKPQLQIAAVHAREILDTVRETATFSCPGLRRSTPPTSELGVLSLRQPLLNFLILSNDLLTVYKVARGFEFISLHQPVRLFQDVLENGS